MSKSEQELLDRIIHDKFFSFLSKIKKISGLAYEYRNGSYVFGENLKLPFDVALDAPDRVTIVGELRLTLPTNYSGNEVEDLEIIKSKITSNELFVDYEMSPQHHLTIQKVQARGRLLRDEWKIVETEDFVAAYMDIETREPNE